MATVKPFKAVYYNSDKVKDFSKVVAPPYDIISDEEQTRLHNLSSYNFTHIDYAKDKSGDNKENNKYIRAKKIFQDWLKKGVMVQGEEPGIYFYRQQYKVMGQRYNRLGFIALMELKDDGESKVRPHENTHAKAVDDRLRLTRALSANLSPIFVCYSDKQRKVEKTFNRHVVSQKPMIDVTDKDGVHHQLWALTDPALIKEISQSLNGQNLFIADGHHRYKVATEYRKARLTRRQHIAGTEPFNYVMTYFTNIDAKDLQIFSMHRIVKRLPKKLDFIDDYFRIDKLKNKEELLILLAKAGLNEHAFGLYTKEGTFLLRLKNKTLINKMVKEGSKDYKSLDATILKSFIFDRIGLESSDIIYTKDFNQTIDMVDSGEAEASFILNPVKISQLKAIALNGERMPPKTTYFYPKLLSGLTVYQMQE